MSRGYSRTPHSHSVPPSLPTHVTDGANPGERYPVVEGRETMRGHELVLVGRSSELKTLTGLLRDTGLGLPRAAVVTGEAGIGKSRLLAEFMTVAAERGLQPVTARAQPATRDIPGGTLLQLLPASPPPTDEASKLWWMRNALLGIAERPVLVIDDAHLADELTLSLCAVLADSGRLPVVLAARATRDLPESLDHLGSTPGVKTVELRSLSLEGTRQFVNEMEHEPITLGTARELHELTGGVPLVLRELVRAARDTGVPVSDPNWTWTDDIAADPGLGSLLEGRLGHTSDVARQVLWMTLAAGGSLPVDAAVHATSRHAVDEVTGRGLLREDDGWLRWPHALLGELAARFAGREELSDAGHTLTAGLRRLGRDEPSYLRLAARVDLESPAPDPEIQLHAARQCLNEGLNEQALEHADAALATTPTEHEARFLAAQSAIRLSRADGLERAGRALDSCESDDQVLRTATRCALLLFATTADADTASQLISDAIARLSGTHLTGRLEYVRLFLLMTALPSEEFVAEAAGFIDSPDANPVDRQRVEGLLSIGLAALGDIERATRGAAVLRNSLSGVRLDYEQETGFFGGAMASVFAGDAHEATRLVIEGSAVPPPPDQPEVAVGRRTMAATMGPFRGHCRGGMPDFVRPADESASLRYSLMTRIFATWELALRRDATASAIWEEVQQAPRHLRAGPAFLEGIVEVALVASRGDTDAAAMRALELADAVGPARSAAAWLLHDAARHGRAAEVVERLDQIAATQPDRYLPAIMADSARAMADGEDRRLVEVASEFRNGGFDLFAAEAEVLASRLVDPDATVGSNNDPTARARADIARAGNPWTPIVDDLAEPEELTPRQREIARLVVDGLTNGEVAARLGISKRTVENQLYRVYAKLGVDRAGLSELRL